MIEIPGLRNTWSEETFRIFGIEPCENMPFDEFIAKVHPKDRDFVKAAVDKSMEQGMLQDIEYRILRPHGSIRYVRSGAHVFKNEEGQATRMIGFVQDITEQRNYQKSLRASNEKLKKMSHRLDAVRENDMKKIAMRLHDDLSQDLSAVKLGTYSVIEKLKSKPGLLEVEKNLIKKLYNLIYLTTSAIDKVRNISHELSPPVLNKLGLEPALELLLETFENSHNIKIDYKFSIKDLDLDQRFSISVYRIVQESLTNVWKHAQATLISVSMVFQNNELLLEIRDNGIGMELMSNMDKKEEGLGLFNIRERIFHWNGQLKINSCKNKGTQILITYPYPLAPRKPDNS